MINQFCESECSSVDSDNTNSTGRTSSKANSAEGYELDTVRSKPISSPGNQHVLEISQDLHGSDSEIEFEESLAKMYN